MIFVVHLKKIVLFHINNETYVGRGRLSSRHVRSREFTATDTEMTSTFVEKKEKKSIIDTG